LGQQLVVHPTRPGAATLQETPSSGITQLCRVTTI
jgi:hypothetical protein